LLVGLNTSRDPRGSLGNDGLVVDDDDVVDDDGGDFFRRLITNTMKYMRVSYCCYKFVGIRFSVVNIKCSIYHLTIFK
jgi:hypothetical protein